eukprot:CAMPEP_0118947880 /NCGR_PEP_ID=MMETSP1169-20130426/46820_1 /TAXON_ID=36882 /ORGANISM="Pyramimonas obovata, Strain CCMP722" /LENGTH=257 /DNA_ID=CAMNT_0006894185 /DNA_START=183 /DNA_END=956 /DNA_ORIENTATION=+
MASASASFPEAEVVGAVQDAKDALKEAIDSTNRGVKGGTMGRARVAECQVALEKYGVLEDLDTSMLAGTWRLLYTSAPDVVSVLQLEQTGLFQIGEIYQAFTAEGGVENVIKFSVPYLLQPLGPGGAAGLTLRVEASYEIRGPRTIGLAFLEGKVGELRISDFLEQLLAPALLPRTFVQMQILQLLRDLELKFPLRGNLPGGMSAPPVMGGGLAYQLTYLDDTTLVGRAAGSGGTFIFERAADDELDVAASGDIFEF